MQQEEVESGGYVAFSALVLLHLRKLLSESGVAASLFLNAPDGHGSQLWGELTREFDPAIPHDFIRKSTGLVRHSPVKLEQLPVAILA